MINYKLIAMKFGEGLKYGTSINEIERVATAVFDFGSSSHPHENITSSRSQLIYDWVMTLSEQAIDEEKKLLLLQDFINYLTPQGNPLRNLIKEVIKLPQLDFWAMIHPDVITVSQKKFEDGHYADAVESAFKEFNCRVQKTVKQKTGKEPNNHFG